MPDIIEFLEARITEDEAAVGELETSARGAHREALPGTDWVASPLTAGRVRAECAAKRKILGNVPLVADNAAEIGGTSEYVLMFLAAAYSRHPDYQESWYVED